MQLLPKFGLTLAHQSQILCSDHSVFVPCYFLLCVWPRIFSTLSLDAKLQHTATLKTSLDNQVEEQEQHVGTTTRSA